MCKLHTEIFDTAQGSVRLELFAALPWSWTTHAGRGVATRLPRLGMWWPRAKMTLRLWQEIFKLRNGRSLTNGAWCKRHYRPTSLRARFSDRKFAPPIAVLTAIGRQRAAGSSPPALLSDHHHQLPLTLARSCLTWMRTCTVVCTPRKHCALRD